MALEMGASNDVIQMVLLMTMLVCVLTTASSDCPRGCVCGTNKGTVHCNSIGSFPTELPAATKMITIMRSNLQEIPTGAFDYLQHLKSITFMEMTIGTIRRRAFYRIGRDIHNKVLTFNKVNIENIEQEAFEELEHFRSISIHGAKLVNVSSGAFSKLSNIRDFGLSQVTVPTLRSDTFTTFSNVTSVTIKNSAIDLIEEEAFSNFTHVESFDMREVRVGTLGSRFITSYGTGTVDIVRSTFGLWQECSFCGIRATSFTAMLNIVNGTEGNVFKGISVVKSLTIFGNRLPFVVARFIPFHLPDDAAIYFTDNNLTTIRCEGGGPDYPSNIRYVFHSNEVTCDCRLNWMWKKWSKTDAAQRFTHGFDCAGPERQSLSNYFRKVSASEITPPCDGVEPVDDCAVNTTESQTPTTESQTTTTESQTTTDGNAAAAISKASGMSILAVILLSLMAS